MTSRWLIVGLAGALTAACASDPEGLPDAGAGRDAAASGADAAPLADAGGSADAAAGRDAGVVPGDDTPIVDRPSTGAYTCTLSRPRTDHSPRTWGSSGHSMITTSGGAAYFARLESTPMMPFDPAPVSYLLSTLSTDGTFGAPTTVSATGVDDVRSPVLARRGDGLALLWVEQTRFRFAAFDAAGARTLGPVDVYPGAIEQYSAWPEIAAATGGGFGVVYSREGASSARDVWFLALERDGVRQGAPRKIATSPLGWANPAPTIVPSGDGFAIAWGHHEQDRGHVMFTTVDAAGVERIAPRRISVTDRAGVDAASGVGFDRARVALLPVDGGFLAAWAEIIVGDIQNGADAQSIIRLARLDASGALAADPVALRTGTVDIDEVEPTLTALADGSVAVMWARGSHIYACGGCVPDHRVDLVVVDPASFARLSDVVSLAPENGGRFGGGFLARDVVALGDQLLLAFDVTFHVHATASSAAFTCTR